MKYYYKKNAKIASPNEIRDFKVFIKLANDIIYNYCLLIFTIIIICLNIIYLIYLIKLKFLFNEFLFIFIK